MQSQTYVLTDLPRVAEQLLRTCGPARTYALVGELGSGKTTLVAEMCRQLGVTEPTSSPTYAIVNQYSGRETEVYHLDCYRLKTVDEALDAGLEEIFAEDGRTVFVEWPGVIEPLLPPDVVYLRLSHDALGGPGRQLVVSTGHPPS